MSISPLQNILSDFQILLCSSSPRRKLLLTEMGIDFTIVQNNFIEETNLNLAPDDLVINLSLGKSLAYNSITEKDILITVDTIVWYDDKIIGKPKDSIEAKLILQILSGHWHEVYTGITLRNQHLTHSFFDVTKVKFKSFDDDEIDYYIDAYLPFDKAGSYGAQEWLGYIGIEKIEGSFFNVMGLPTNKFYEELISFVSKIK